MINVGVVGDTGRAGTLRTCFNRMGDRARIYGYYNYGEKNDSNYVYYETFDEMINDPNIQAVAISNYFCSHTELAIKALDAGKHVLSEVTACVTPKECVELCEAVERNHCVYALMESHAFLPTCVEMKSQIETGVFGPIVYAEGEYCHPMSPSSAKTFMRDSKEHWRAYRPCTFYADHALGPIMWTLGVMPTSVVAKGATGSKEFAQSHGYNYSELAGVMLVSTDKDILVNVKGCTHYSGRGRYYRYNGEDGGIEIVRGDGFVLRKFFNSWTVPVDVPDRETKYSVVYPPEFVGDLAIDGVPHEGADLFVVRNFLDAIDGIAEPYFDVYKSVAMSAVQIYGWRSMLNGSINMPIPDFRDKVVRECVRDDDLTPFIKDGVPPTLPCSLHPVPRIDE